MLAIRMQRTGRKGHAMFRMVVQDARRTPTSGKIVAFLGSYDPHSKTVSIDQEKASFYLNNGAHPSPRASTLLKSEKVKLPSWVEITKENKGAVRFPDKRRSTRPPEAKEPEAKTDDVPAETEAVDKATAAETEAPATEDNAAEAPAEDTRGEAETPADEPKEEPAA